MEIDGGPSSAKKAAGSDVTLLHEAARQAAALVEDGMVIGMGSGRAANLTLRLLAERARTEGLRIRGVPTSERTAALAGELGFDLLTLEESPRLDLDLDGADEVDPNLNLIKGLGGALLREKIVAFAAAPRLVIIVDESKLVARLGARAPLPVEVVPFGWQSTARTLERLQLHPVLRQEAGQAVRTDGGNYILDCYPRGDSLPPDLLGLAGSIKAVTGVVEHGLFPGMVEQVMVGVAGGGVRVLQRDSWETAQRQGAH